MDVQVEISSVDCRATRTLGPDYLPLLNDGLAAWDVLVVLLGGFVACRMLPALSGHGLGLHATNAAMLRDVVPASLLAALVLHDRGLSAPSGHAAAGPVLRRLLLRAGLAAALLLGTALATRPLGDATSGWALLWAGQALGAALLGRLVVLLHVRRLLRRGALRSVVAVVGEGEAALHVMHSLSRGGSGIELLGPFGGAGSGGAWSAGSVDDLVRLARQRGLPDRVIVAAPATGTAGGSRPGRHPASGWDDGDELSTMVQRLKVLPVEISLCRPLSLHVCGDGQVDDQQVGAGQAGAVPRGGAAADAGLSGPAPARLRMAELTLARLGLSGEVAGLGAIDRLPLLRVAERPLPAWGGLAKHALDKALAGVAVLLLSPLLLAIAAAVRLDSAGPAIFRQERDGWNGRSFTVLKFRTMRAAPADGALLQTVRGDPRCTRLGRFLRRSSLDELPQLLNVLRGEMSLVGPRPHALEMRTEDRLGHEIIAEYAQRHRVRPGLTGLAQVRGLRGATHTAAQLRARVECDLDYIEGWSFLLDLRILALTVVKVFSAAGAF